PKECKDIHAVVGSTGSHQFRTVAPTTFKPYPDTITVTDGVSGEKKMVGGWSWMYWKKRG
ncbi:hypothetical protein B9Q04_13995, partial [Candidatus Marsarchaeota G2 archaeon BE_D]